MEDDASQLIRGFPTRCVYNSEFVHNFLLDYQYLSRLTSVYRHNTYNVLYSGVAREMYFF